jgi:formate dehydrogenase iron-sulfur subunit
MKIFNKPESEKDLKVAKGSRALSRRDFLKLTVPVASLSVVASELASATPAAAATTPSAAPGAVAMLYDASKCLGCRRCEDACRREHQLPSEYRPADLSAKSLSVIKYNEVKVNGKAKWLPTKWQCMSCIEPTCVSVCPVGALTKTDAGPVSYDESKCIGCQYCVSACPFSIPRFDFANQKINKCDFCANRQSDGKQPACSEVCPAGALTFGKRDAVITKAASAQAAYSYGLKEAGGTSWIYVSEVPLEDRGLPAVTNNAYPSHSKAMLVPQIGTLAASAAGLGLVSVLLRKRNLSEAKNETDDKSV